MYDDSAVVVHPSIVADAGHPAQRGGLVEWWQRSDQVHGCVGAPVGANDHLFQGGTLSEEDSGGIRVGGSDAVQVEGVDLECGDSGQSAGEGDRRGEPGRFRGSLNEVSLQPTGSVDHIDLASAVARHPGAAADGGDPGETVSEQCGRDLRGGWPPVGRPGDGGSQEVQLALRVGGGEFRDAVADVSATAGVGGSNGGERCLPQGEGCAH